MGNWRYPNRVVFTQNTVMSRYLKSPKTRLSIDRWFRSDDLITVDREIFRSCLACQGHSIHGYLTYKIFSRGRRKLSEDWRGVGEVRAGKTHRGYGATVA